MIETGKEYYYKNADSLKHSVLVKRTSVWNIFENGDYIDRRVPIYESMEAFVGVRTLVNMVHGYRYAFSD